MSFDGDLYPTAGASTVMTTKGDMVDYDTARQRLGIGSTNQILQVTAGGLPAWQTLSTAGSVLTTQGDVLMEGGAGLARLGQSTDNYTLATKGAGANPKWQASATSVLTASGDVLYASGANTLARLAKATDGDTLQLSSGVPAWVTVGAGAGVETGTILPYGGDTGDSLSDYLFCDGTAVSRTTYSDLFAVTGTNFGVGDGATTFNVPDMQSKFPRGTSSAQGGATGGADALTLSEAQMPTHNHTINDSGHSHTIYRNQGSSGSYKVIDYYTKNKYAPDLTINSATTGITINDAGSSSSFDNKPAYLELLYIIKT